MGRPLRLVADGLVDHALNRGNNRAPVFVEAADYQLFLQALGPTKSRYPFRLYAFCLMGNHFHVVLEPEVGQTPPLLSLDNGPAPAPTGPRW